MFNRGAKQRCFAPFPFLNHLLPVPEKFLAVTSFSHAVKQKFHALEFKFHALEFKFHALERAFQTEKLA